MLKNYIKLALKVLSRRKFFTFISLFGISFTLMVLMLIASFIETEFGDNPPLSRNEDLVFIPMLSELYYQNDTIRDIDTLFNNGIATFDTTHLVKRQNEASYISNSSMSHHVLEKYFTGLNAAEQSTFFSPDLTYDVYINNSKLSIKTCISDEGYWKVFDFMFKEGRPYNADEIKRGALVAVITQSLSRKYFGTVDNLLGKEIEMDDKHFKIIGVVATPTSSANYVGCDIYIPYTAFPENKDPSDYFGSFMAVFLIKNNSNIHNLKKEILYRISKIPILKPEDYNVIEAPSATFSETYAQQTLYDKDPEKSKRNLFLIMASFIALFVLLPVLNLINLNISRILDRSSEIGVRKAFGANTKNILFQFVFENIIQTFIGGLLGLVFALVAIYLINDSQLLNNVRLVINFNFFIACFFISLLFGIISGLLPALKMSKLSIVNALKQNNI